MVRKSIYSAAVLVALSGGLVGSAQASVVVDPFTTADPGNYAFAQPYPTYTTSGNAFSTDGAGTFNTTTPANTTQVYTYTGASSGNVYKLTNTGDSVSIDVNLATSAPAQGLRISTDAPVTSQADGLEFALFSNAANPTGGFANGTAFTNPTGVATLTITRQAAVGGSTPYLATVTRNGTVFGSETQTLASTDAAFFGPDVFGGTAGESNFVFNAVPEPAALSLLGLGALGLLGRRSRKA